jgi:hypothetical protein
MLISVFFFSYFISMNLIRYTFVFLFGVYVGQEFKSVPNVRVQAIEYYNQFTTTEFYKKLKDDFKKK